MLDELLGYLSKLSLVLAAAVVAVLYEHFIAARVRKQRTSQIEQAGEQEKEDSTCQDEERKAPTSCGACRYRDKWWCSVLSIAAAGTGIGGIVGAASTGTGYWEWVPVSVTGLACLFIFEVVLYRLVGPAPTEGSCMGGLSPGCMSRQVKKWRIGAVCLFVLIVTVVLSSGYTGPV